MSNDLYQSGEFIGYKVEKQLFGDDKWKSVNFNFTEKGVPYPECEKFILAMIGYLGYEQAMTIAWWIRAESKLFKVRIVPYKFKYRIDYEREDKNINYINDEKI